MHSIKDQDLPQIYLAALDHRLSDTIRHGKIFPATAKSVAEIGVSDYTKEPTHAPIAWFFVGTRSSFLGVLLAYLVGGTCRVMAVRARAPQGAPGSFVTGYANLVRAATRLRLASSGGRENLTTKEAATMATVPTLAVTKTYTFLISPRSCRLAALRRICIVTTVAHTEAEARAHLVGLPLVFIARRLTGEVAA